MEMFGSPWFDVEEGIQKQGDWDAGVDLSFKTYLPLREGPADKLSSILWERNLFFSEGQTLHGTRAIQFENLNGIRVMDLRGRVQVTIFNCQRQVGVITRVDSSVKQ